MSTFPVLDMFTLDRRSGVTMQRQLCHFLRSEILAGRLKPQIRVPPSRELAHDLSIARNTVLAAYDELIAEGFLETRRGVGTVVASLPQSALLARQAGSAIGLPRLSRRGMTMVRQRGYATIPGQRAFHPGSPEIGLFPFSVWRRLVARYAGRTGEDIHGYHNIRGHPRLRGAIAGYLSIARGMKISPEQVIVFTGAQAALDLLSRLLVDEGDPVWIEEPGYAGAYSALLAAGARPAPLPVGPAGWEFDEAANQPRLIFVTPSCQWPLGRVMRMDERLHLLKLAEEHDAWIIEDDYDAEYRFRGPPLPALQGLDRSGRVIYIGTYAKILFPALRIGFAIVPAELVEGFSQALSYTGQYPPMLLQLALADFIEEGHFVTHLRRMRRLYAARQKHFVKLCRRDLGQWLTVDERDTGIQLLGRFLQPRDDCAIADKALEHGVDVSPLSIHYRYGGSDTGLLLGYAGVDERAAVRGIRVLREVLKKA